MSARCMGRVWELSRHKGSELLVLLAIADYAKDDGSGAWPSIGTLVSKTRLSERSVQYCLKALEASGELQIERGTGPHGSNMYHVRLVKCEQCGGQGCKLCTPEKFAPVQSTTARGAKSAPLGVQPVAPKPLSEPSIKPLATPLPARATLRVRPHVMPADYEVTAGMLDAARRKAAVYGVNVNFAAVADQFLTYHKRGKGRTKTAEDWEAEWELWYGRELIAREPTGTEGGRYARSVGKGLYGGDRAVTGSEPQSDLEGFTIIRRSNIAGQ